MIDPLSAYLAYSTGKKWLPYAIGGGLGLALGCLIAWGAWSFQGERIDARTAERDSARQSRDMALADATRWASAAQMRDGVIKAQKDQIDKLVKDAAESQTAALELIDEANARADSTERKLAQLRKQAHDAPEADKPRPLSPAARAGLEWLRCRAKAPADPGTCGGASGL